MRTTTRIIAAACTSVMLCPISAFAQLIDNNDGTVTQIRADGTKLMWLKNAGYVGQMPLADAQTYLANTTIAGYSDWRLPTVYNIPSPGSWLDSSSELNNLYYVEFGLATYEGAKTPQPPFENIQAGYYLTSTLWSDLDPVAGNDNNVMVFTFLDPINPDAAYNNSGMGFVGDISYSNPVWPVRDIPLAPTFTCLGFKSPLDKGVVKVKKSRALPHKADLTTDIGGVITDLDIQSAPVIQVTYQAVNAPSAVDVTDLSLSSGEGTAGNSFSYSQEGHWQFNLLTKNFTAKGTYTVSLVSGDQAEYLVSQTCSASFTIE